jgi:hypothetical protein
MQVNGAVKRSALKRSQNSCNGPDILDEIPAVTRARDRRLHLVNNALSLSLEVLNRV